MEIDIVTNPTTVTPQTNPTSLAITSAPQSSIVQVGIAGPQGPQGPIGPSGGSSIDILAAENIAAFQCLTADGHVANSANAGHFGAVVGIATAAISTGFVGQAQAGGELTNNAWSWAPNAKIFLNGTSLSTTPPSSGFSQQIAIARNANTIVVEIQPPILL